MLAARRAAAAAPARAPRAAPAARAPPRASAARRAPCRRAVRARLFDRLRDFVAASSGGGAEERQRQQEQQQRGASAGGELDGEEEEGAELVPIDTEGRGGLGGTSDGAFGPLAVLLLGFLPEEFDAFRAMMLDMEADEVKIVACTRAMLGSTLQAALEAEAPQYEQPPLGQRRAVVLSGMYGCEVTEVIAAYRDAGLPPCAFAAAVPNNFTRNVKELSEAIWRDHSAMLAKQQQRRAGSSVEDDS
ncbi:hypothetical protein HT031_000874 [Scenedesmus sp. PABB004]|nr:hypothetical protein HT031_000874 [Scenedesmus sp. PABB004]